jgi:hypothetical protein
VKTKVALFSGDYGIYGKKEAQMLLSMVKKLRSVVPNMVDSLNYCIKVLAY